MADGWLSAVVIVAIAACDVRPDFTPDCEPEMRDWVLECIGKANPHSDEEPADNTRQCEKTAVRLFCGPTCFVSVDGPIVCRQPLRGGRS